MTRRTRRELLGSATVLGAIAVAGCLGRAREEGSGPPETTDEENPDQPRTTDVENPDQPRTTDEENPDQPRTTDEENPDGTDGEGDDTGDADRIENDETEDSITNAAVEETSIETVASDCDSPPDDQHTVDTTGDIVVIEGTLPAPDPCHEATLASVSLVDGTLSIVIDVVDTGGICPTCIGAVSYRATVEPTDSADVESVTIEHATPVSTAIK